MFAYMPVDLLQIYFIFLKCIHGKQKLLIRFAWKKRTVCVSPQNGTYFAHLEMCTKFSLGSLFSAELNNVKHISLG